MTATTDTVRVVAVITNAHYGPDGRLVATQFAPVAVVVAPRKKGATQ